MLIFRILLFYIFIKISRAQQNPKFNQTEAVEMQEALLFSQTVEKKIIDFIQQKLPPSEQSKGVKILEETKIGLAQCESNLQRVDEIGQYKTCSSNLLQKAMINLSTEVQTFYSSFSDGGVMATSKGVYYLNVLLLILVLINI